MSKWIGKTGGYLPCAVALLLASVSVSAQQATGEEAGQAAVAPVPEERRLDVMEYQVEGNTLLSAYDISKVLVPFTGPDRTVGEVEAARAALEQAYRERGYETVGIEIPQQDVRGGVIRFKVVELRVGQLRVTGSRYYSPDVIKARMPSLEEGEVPRYDLVTRDIARINNTRDRIITPTLRAGAAPGTVDVDLEVEDSAPVHGTLELNDRFSTNTSRLRLVAGLSYANLFQRDHSFNLQMQVSPEEMSEAKVISGSYLAPFPDSDFSLVVYGVHSDSDVAAVGGIDVLGSGQIYGLRGVFSLPAAGRFSHQLMAGIDYKNFEEDLVLGADNASTPISYSPLSLAYSLNALDRRGSTSGGLSLNFGSRLLGGDNEEFGRKRYGAEANFFYVRADLKRTQQLPGDFRLTAALAAQLADQPLISNEGFSIGGQDSVRGYSESHTVGDQGLQWSVQLDTPSLHELVGLGDGSEWRLFAFYEGGEVEIKEPLADTNGNVVKRIALASYGVGTSISLFNHYHLMAYLADPTKQEARLKYDVRDEYRAGFRLWAEF